MAPFNLGRSVSTHSPYHGRLREGRVGIKKLKSCVRRLEAERVASRALMGWMRSRCGGVAERSGGADGAERRDDTAGASRATGWMISANLEDCQGQSHASTWALGVLTSSPLTSWPCIYHIL